MRDHRKLRAFELADELALTIYQITRSFPSDERFGLTSQLRRGAVSIASNIVEGCARDGMADYIRFLDIAYAAACELEYQVSLAERLGFLDSESAAIVRPQTIETTKVLSGLLRSLRRKLREP